MASLALAFDILARDRASKEFDKVSKASKRAGDSGTDFGKKFGKGIKVAALAIGGLGAAAVAGFVPLIKDAAESARVGRLTTQVIKSTGGAAKVTAAQVGDLATAISNRTGMDDEAIQSGQNLLLTFKNIRNEAGKGNDIFSQTSSIMADMSAALGQDTKTSAIQLGKALNDPIKGVSALQKVGVSFTKGQKDQIKTLVKSGRTMDAQKLILKELGSEFGGAAAAASDPMQKLTTTLGNLGEKIGGLLLPYVEKFATWLGDKAVPAVSKFADWLGPRISAAMKSLGKWLNGTVIPAIKDFVSGFQNGTGAGGKFHDALDKIVAIAKDVGTWIGQNATLVKSLGAALLSGVTAFKVITGVVKAYTVVQGILNVVMAANPIGIVIVAIAALAGGLIYAYKTSETFRNVVSKAFSVVKIGALTLAKVAVTAFQFLANVWMTVVGAVLDGAAAAFGWVPGVGPKLRGAAAKFHEFKDNANRELNKVKTSIDLSVNTEKAKLAVDGVVTMLNKFNGKVFTATVRTNFVTIGNAPGLPGTGVVTKQRAHGGPVSAGHVYSVGENPDGSWNRTTELFVPGVNGRVFNQSQIAAAMRGGGGGGELRLSQFDIDRLAGAVANIHVRGEISARSFDVAMAGGL